MNVLQTFLLWFVARVRAGGLTDMLAVEKVAKLKAEATRLERLIAHFPDLRESADRWNNVRLCAKSVNARVTGCEVRYSCGCCTDAAVQAWPFLEVEGERVYSDPPCLYVGTRDDDAGDRPQRGWDQQFFKYGINAAVLPVVASVLTGPTETEQADA